MPVSDESIITLISSDNIKFTLPVKAAKFSGLVSDALLKSDDDNDDDDDDDNDNADNNVDVNKCNNTNDKGGMKLDDGISNTATGHGGLEMDLPRVGSAALEKVVEFLNYFATNPFQKIPEKNVSTFSHVCFLLLFIF